MARRFQIRGLPITGVRRCFHCPVDILQHRTGRRTLLPIHLVGLEPPLLTSVAAPDSGVLFGAFLFYARPYIVQGEETSAYFFGRPFVKRFALLSDRCPASPGYNVGVLWPNAVGWIKTKLGTEVGLGSGHIALDGDPASPPPKKRGTQ